MYHGTRMHDERVHFCMCTTQFTAAKARAAFTPARARARITRLPSLLRVCFAYGAESREKEIARMPNAWVLCWQNTVQIVYIVHINLLCASIAYMLTRVP